MWHSFRYLLDFNYMIVHAKTNQTDSHPERQQDIQIYFTLRSICSHSLASFPIIDLGHHAPPLRSTRILKIEKFKILVFFKLCIPNKLNKSAKLYNYFYLRTLKYNQLFIVTHLRFKISDVQLKKNYILRINKNSFQLIFYLKT